MKRPSANAVLGALLAFLYLYPFPYFEEMGSANELPRVYLTRAIVDEGTVAIDTGVAAYKRQYRRDPVDVSPWRGHVFSNKAPGSSFLAVPVYLALKGVCALFGAEPTTSQETWAFRVATGVVPTLLFLLLFWRFLARYVPDPAARRMVLAAYAVGSMAFIYSILFIAHQLSAVCLASAWILSVRVIEDDRSPRWMLLVGFLAGAAPLVDYQAAFAGVPVAAYVLWKFLRRPPRRALHVVLAVAGAVPPIAALLTYHALAFDSPWRTGYAASETFARYHQRGFLGMDELRWDAFVGSTVAPDNGLLFLCPMLLLVLPGLWLLARRRDWWTFGITAAVVTIYLLFISSLSFWRGGWQVGPRYITAMLPFAMVPVAVLVAKADTLTGRWRDVARGGAVALVAASMVIYGLSAAFFPHFPENFKNPLHDIVLRLLAEGYAPFNGGHVLGLRGWVSVVPYLLALAGLIVWVAVPSRARLRSGCVGLALAALLIAVYGAAPRGGENTDTSYWRITTWMTGGSPAAEPRKNDPRVALSEKLARKLTSRCDAGDLEGCRELGVLLAEGVHLRADPTRARALFERGCDGGVPKACDNLGLLYATGNGVAASPARAAELYGKACDAGVALGCRNLGLMLEGDRGVPADLGRAAALFQKSCEAGSAFGCNNLGLVHLKGRGVPAAPAAAREWFHRACEGGDPSGCRNLGGLYLEGLGVAKGDAPAAVWLERACTGNDAAGCRMLGVLLLEGRGVARDEARAREVLTRACKGLDKPACVVLVDHGWAARAGNTAAD